MTTEGMEAYCDAMSANTRADGWITDRDPKEEGLYLVSIGRYRGVRYWLDGWMGQETPDGWMQIPAPVIPDGIAR